MYLSRREIRMDDADGHAEAARLLLAELLEQVARALFALHEEQRGRREADRLVRLRRARSRVAVAVAAAWLVQASRAGAAEQLTQLVELPVLVAAVHQTLLHRLH